MKKITILIIAILLQIISVKAQTVTGIVTDSNGVRLYGLTVQLYSMGLMSNSTSYMDGTFSIITPNEVKEKNLPEGYSISNNYPNPFNPKTRIDFSFPKTSNVKVEIYNIAGQRVLDVIEKNINPGNNYIDIEMKGLSNGFYLARILIDGIHIVTKKLILLYGSQHLTQGKVAEKTKIERTSKVISFDSLIISGDFIERIKINLPLPVSDNKIDLGKIIVKKLAIPKYENCPAKPTLIYAGKTYHTVQIGSQCWLKENLDVGLMIPVKQVQANNNIIEKYCYDNNSEDCKAYGGLYSWTEAMQYTNITFNPELPHTPFSAFVQGICPSGWHIPSKAEFQTLITYVNRSRNSILATGQFNGKDDFGFSALFSGYNINNKFDFSAIYHSTQFWTSSRYSNLFISSIMLYDYENSIFDWILPDTCGISVRCIKDEESSSLLPSIPTHSFPDDKDTYISNQAILNWNEN